MVRISTIHSEYLIKLFNRKVVNTMDRSFRKLVSGIIKFDVKRNRVQKSSVDVATCNCHII